MLILIRSLVEIVLQVMHDAQAEGGLESKCPARNGWEEGHAVLQ